MGRAGQTTALWKRRKAGVRALRDISSCVLPHAGVPRSPLLWSWSFPSMTNPRSIPKTNWAWLPAGHTTSGAVRTAISALAASHLAQLDQQPRVARTLPSM